MPIHYTIGDATHPEGDGPKVLPHICNDLGGWGRGYVLALSRRWKAPEAAYRAWSRGEGALDFALGQVQHVQVADDTWVSNMVAQHGTRPKQGVVPIRYPAVRACLEQVAEFALEHGATVHMPRIGAGLAGGNWSTIEAIIEETLCAAGVPVTVYDLPPEPAEWS
jgi:O-acetyl-ADP-ribose deacetylase (regulator of RNase III)